MSNDITCIHCGETYCDKYDHACAPEDVSKHLRQENAALEERVSNLEDAMTVFAAGIRILQGHATVDDFNTVANYKGPYDLKD